MRLHTSKPVLIVSEPPRFNLHESLAALTSAQLKKKNTETK